MFERQRHALALGLVLLAVAAAMAVMMYRAPLDSVLQPVDDRWLDVMVDVRTAWVTDLATVLSVLGGPLVTVPLRLLVTVVLAFNRRWLQLGAWVGAIVSSELCIGPLKAIVDRPRPPGGLHETTSASFPSGHAIAASVTALGLVVVLHPPVRARTRWTLVAAGFATAMALSRTYLAVHWLTDVVAGVCIGVGWALVWPAALELIRVRRSAPVSEVPAVRASNP
ncbi:MAG TPA: phosphatase PAP2 family protein [Ilumatobacteraceae bacterium]|nr:phosphatase PAP2 family protein [Ilumatobacteraceae bacterium]